MILKTNCSASFLRVCSRYEVHKNPRRWHVSPKAFRLCHFKAPRSRCEFCNSGNRKSIYKKHFCASACRPTLPVGSGRDLRRVGQSTGDQPLTAEDHHGVAGEIAENAHQRIRRPQSRVSGDVDINLEEESEKTEGSMETQR